MHYEVSEYVEYICNIFVCFEFDKVAGLSHLNILFSCCDGPGSFARDSKLGCRL